MTETVPVPENAPYRKAALIQEALQSLRTAQRIDERDELDAASFLEWYDRTIPDVRDIKILAGAMEIELARRRGERILQEGERRGGDQSKGSQCDPLLSEAVKMERKRDRILALEPVAVHAYVQREVRAGKVPTKRGARRAAHGTSAGRASGAARRAWAPRPAVTPTPMSDGHHIHRGQRHEESNRKTLAALEYVADGVRRTDAQLAKATGEAVGKAAAARPVHHFLERVRLIPWLTIDRTSEGTIFRIDTQLRAICETLQPRPELSYQSIATYLRALREELTRKRKENHDERRKTRWDSRLILTRIQSDMLDWIEDQLDRMPTQ